MAVTITPGLAGSTYRRTVLNGSTQITFGPAPVVDSFPGDTAIWAVAGDPWTTAGDSVTLANPAGNNDFLSTITEISQTAAGPVTLRVNMAGVDVDNTSGGYGITLECTDAGGLGGGNVLGAASELFNAGTSLDQQYSVTVTPVALTNPASALTPVTVAETTTLAAGTYFVNVAEQNNEGTTTPGSSESSIVVTADAEAIQFTYALPQNVGCTGIVVGMGTATGAEAQFATVSSAGVVAYIGTNAAGVTATVNAGTLTVTITAAPTDTTHAMPTVNTAAATPIVYCYAYLFARNGPGTVTLHNAELFSATATGVTTAQYGEWVMAPADIYEVNAQPIAAGTLAPATIAFYYGTPEDVDNLDSVTHSITVLSQYSIVVMNAPTLLSARGKLVLQGLLAAGVRVFGYNNVGVAPAPSIATINALTLACAASGYAGCMFDGFGYDYGVTRATQNTVVAYAHSLGLAAIANAWVPADALGSVVNATYNPTGTPPLLGKSDLYLFESFYTTDANEYEAAVIGWPAMVTKYTGGVALAQALGVKCIALAYAWSTTPLGTTTDQLNSYLLALTVGCSVWCYQGSTSSNLAAWPPLPAAPPVVGDTLTTPLEQTATATYTAVTDQGVLTVDVNNTTGAVTSASNFGTAYALPPVIYGAPPASDPAIQQATSIWETAYDEVTWKALGTTPERYLRLHMYFRDAT